MAGWRPPSRDGFASAARRPPSRGRLRRAAPALARRRSLLKWRSTSLLRGGGPESSARARSRAAAHVELVLDGDDRSLRGPSRLGPSAPRSDPERVTCRVAAAARRDQNRSATAPRADQTVIEATRGASAAENLSACRRGRSPALVSLAAKQTTSMRRSTVPAPTAASPIGVARDLLEFFEASRVELLGDGSVGAAPSSERRA